MSISVELSNFSIKQICDSGQCFRMRELIGNEKAHAMNYVLNNSDFNKELESYEDADVIEVIAKRRRLLVIQKEMECIFDCDEDELKKIWYEYFDLNTDYKRIIDSIDRTDKYLIDAAEFGNGIRILKQDLWEMIISFIISQRNNIKRIRKTIKGLSERYGEKKTSKDGSVYYDFPTPEALYMADIEELKEFGVGYRDKYIKKAAEEVFLKEIDLDYISSLDYNGAKAELLKMFGIGEKVADCISLFALNHKESFPKDTHIFAILDREYKEGFPFEKYDKTAGVLQQYMFYREVSK